ncbi:nuclear nucleic acid-binding protein C1D [Gouania willdenowi]|uniref:Nuclear nucleic acid-binding protein C1D n=1 Tax=Gouania willdenowi TaxID=441366 RepID=A0A8C5EYT2_GOUWI|nr:nuclear nucleic acid-binding protein C1D [Gouania willdenowi]
MEISAENNTEDYPHEIDEQLKTFDSSVSSIKAMLEKLMSVPRNELQQKLEPLEQAKLELLSVYTLNSLFWMYLVTQGVNPKEHALKQELERIKKHMNRVTELTEKKKAARLDRGAASRFVRNALYDPQEKEGKRKSADPGGHAPDAKKKNNK